MFQPIYKALSLLIVVLIITGCSSPTPTSAPNSTATSEPHPAWQSIPFTDVRTGKAIALSEYTGKFIIVEITADWCAVCQEQQRRLIEALKQLDAETTNLLILHIDPSDDVEAIKLTSVQLPSNIIIAMSNSNLDNGLIQQFDKLVNNPPNLPMFFIKSDGSVSKLYTGEYASTDIVGLVRGQSALH